MIHIYAIRLLDSDEIELIRWRNPDTGARGELPVEDLINWLDLGGDAYAVVQGDLRRLCLESHAETELFEAARLEELVALPQF
ncbi:MAG: hypothetical protein QOJ13_973 [Gaiellales bacterium]|jgi:hypothetical protein|nr:hypothetical protein [Gaiellales bacterium]